MDGLKVEVVVYRWCVVGRLGDGRERERDKRDNNTRRGDNRRWVGIPNTWYVSLNSTKTNY
jgi:hypothetical protein